MGDIEEGEPYVDGDLYYFDRLCDWAKKYDMQVRSVCMML